ncbi:MAG: GTP 3',8-cyclase MoaA [Opitutales bacterium]|jgi:GTP 3',8-cyclase|nr:GTP 3',8-cyclase MoaA [Opitutales bacterium]MDP4645262.1 GTP 3',8-cyclase MoaA [Opitutales bacterium]MDP4694629.1 GTP 3',8-cyclase MoaA [Opitutales bacterium]MDP4777338.1 GTP 3',8-cyclase MoaA [Opitutales bacterium]MDP4883606.1 GTP 3',8-cyclase MoaA [Opitutales bacterium]
MVTDKRGRGLTDLRISLTDRCNLRCTYCMPKEIFGADYVFLKKNDWLRFSELDDLVEAFVQLGVKKVRLTGGEPLLRPGLDKYIHGLKHLHKIEDIALTTNGLRLAERVGDLKEAGLDRVTVSLDALDPVIAGKMNGRGIAPRAVLSGIAAARHEGFQVKVNMVVERGVNDGEILPMARYFKELGVTLRFIEFMDVGNHNGWKMERVVSGREILEQIKSEFQVEPVDLSSEHEVAKRYRYADGSGEFGLITSVTQPFCGGCTRARISADGKLYTCLFASQGLDLKSVLRAEGYDKSQLFDLLSKKWGARDDRYSEVRTDVGDSRSKVEMSYIGG